MDDRQTVGVKNPNDELRRKVAQHLIDTKFDGNQSAFARATGKRQTEISDMLRGQKSFGEKVARKMALKAGWPTDIFDREPTAGQTLAARQLVSDQHPVTLHGIKLTIDAARHGEQFDLLNEPFRSVIRTIVELVVAHQIRENRGDVYEPPSKKKSRTKPKKGHDDRPRLD